ncbi:MAG TPA: choice-of-anchor D domain-containing protein [Balneolaceae bacterium]|nr:choice-of-anchor D domain-containing protein [Balneolaceae bacterium]
MRLATGLLALMITLMGLTRVFAADTLSVQDVQSGALDSVDIKINLSNTVPVTGFQFDLHLPDVLHLSHPAGNLSGRAGNQSISIQEISPGVIRVVVFSSNLDTLSGRQGTVATIHCTSGSHPGTYQLGLDHAVVSDTAGQNIVNIVKSGSYRLNAPDIQISTPSLDFGDVPLDTQRTRSLTLSNNGNVGLTIEDDSVSSSTFGLSGLSKGQNLAAGSSKQVSVTYYARSRGDHNGQVTITSDDPDETFKDVSLHAHAFAVNELKVGSVNARSGQKVTIPVQMDNMDSILAMEITINLPEMATYVPGSIQLSDRKTDHTISADTSGGELHIISFSANNASFTGSSGRLFSFQLDLKGQGGSYSLPVREAILTDSSQSNVLSKAIDGSITLTAPRISLSKSRFNFGNVAVGDTLKRFITIENTGNDTLIVQDIQADQPAVVLPGIQNFKISPGENRVLKFGVYADSAFHLDAMVRIRHNDAPHNPSVIPITADFYIVNRLDVLNTSIRPGKTGTLWISMENENDIAGVQFDLTLSPDLIVKSMFLSRRKQNHTLTYNALNDSVYRVLSYSTTGAKYTLQTDTLIGIDLAEMPQPGSYPIHLQHVLLSDPDGNNVASGQVNGFFNIKYDTLYGKTTYWSDSLSAVPESREIIQAKDTVLSVQSSTDGRFQSIIPADTLSLRAKKKESNNDRFAVSVADIIKLQRAVVGLDRPFQGTQKWIADVNGDSVIDVRDGFYLEQFILQRITQLPAGSWKMIPRLHLKQLPASMDTTLRIVSKAGNVRDVELAGVLPGDINGSWPRVASQPKIKPLQEPVVENQVNTEKNKGTSIYTVRITANPGDSVAGWQASLQYNTESVIFSSLQSPLDSLKIEKKVGAAGQGRINLLWHSLTHPIAPPIGNKELAILKFNLINNEAPSFDLLNNTEMVNTQGIRLDEPLHIATDSVYTPIEQPPNDNPKRTRLIGAYPNPFNPVTYIKYQISETRNVSLAVYNALGRKVVQLVNQRQQAGTYNIRFNAAQLTSGVYIYRLKVGHYVQTGKVLLVK